MHAGHGIVGALWTAARRLAAARWRIRLAAGIVLWRRAWRPARLRAIILILGSNGDGGAWA